MRFSTLYASLSSEERARLAKAVDTDPGYLWQLATRWRGKKASLPFIQKLAHADARLSLADMVAEFSEAPGTPPQAPAKTTAAKASQEA